MRDTLAASTAFAGAPMATRQDMYEGLAITGMLKGSTTNITGDRGGIGIKSSTGRGRADRSGSYVLDGFTIELHYDSGKIDRRMFAISTDKEHVFVRLGGEIMPKK